ncbi:outer dense fiber protein 3-like [Mercenaria mercenaria]|uniref:outer dense fiber protein 3-like n=1 Tax=Mercenaria mercenaria TaxID=6596 RepID=UPI001E1DDB40|nr:outer dense fiber protein 3-like [Mercenaria mercenaria]
MESPRRDGENKLAKTIKEQNLKFSVEFENGNVAGHRDNESVTESFKDTEQNTNTVQTRETETTVTKTSHTTTTTQNKEVRVTEQTVKTEKDDIKTTEHNTRKAATKRKIDDSRKQNKDLKLPPIVDSKTSPRETKSFGNTRSEGQKWEKPGDPGQIPIQARIRGPGPAHYMLPPTVGRNNADVTKRQSPAFSFGSRSWSFKTDSPGPAYNFDPLLGPRGKENRPSYSFGVRPRTPVRKNVTPGPGAYDTDRRPLWEKNAPQYSISPRTKMRSVDNGPSPNVYQLPSTLGSNVPNQKGAPSVTLYGRREKHGFAEDLANTPGPARYGAFSPSVTKRKSPEYSVLGRNYNYKNKNITPGPGAYNPQNVNSHLEQSPRHVIGVRHSEFVMPTITPADVTE